MSHDGTVPEMIELVERETDFCQVLALTLTLTLIGFLSDRSVVVEFLFNVSHV